MLGYGGDAMTTQDCFPPVPLRAEDDESGSTIEFYLVPSSEEPFRLAVIGRSGRRTEYRFDRVGKETGSETTIDPVGRYARNGERTAGSNPSTGPRLRVIK